MPPIDSIAEPFAERLRSYAAKQVEPLGRLEGARHLSGDHPTEAAPSHVIGLPWSAQVLNAQRATRPPGE